MQFIFQKCKYETHMAKAVSFSFSIKTFPFEIEGTKLGRILTLPGYNLLEEKLLIGDTITITI
jgi:hypothetical protein